MSRSPRNVENTARMLTVAENFDSVARDDHPFHAARAIGQ